MTYCGDVALCCPVSRTNKAKKLVLGPPRVASDATPLPPSASLSLRVTDRYARPGPGMSHPAIPTYYAPSGTRYAPQNTVHAS